MNHKSGFVNIIGLPNVGKSSIMNALLGDKMVIVTNKPQTTRHRIFGIMNAPEYQVVFSDTPGIIQQTNYKMQKAMNDAAFSTFEDADIILVVIDLSNPKFALEELATKLQKQGVPKLLILNKCDGKSEQEIETIKQALLPVCEWQAVLETSATEKIGIEKLKSTILELLPIGPAYYPKDQLSDKPERFFVAELIRENILKLYHQEIPYSTEVAVTSFKEKEKDGKPIIHIYAIIFCMRRSQKGILLGKGGQSIKQLGIDSRKSIEDYLKNQVFLELHVKIKEKWRDNDNLLKSFGYLH